MGMTTSNINETVNASADQKDEMVTITKSEYDDLVESQKWLACLESAGVDNWSGIDYAHELSDE